MCRSATKLGLTLGTLLVYLVIGFLGIGVPMVQAYFVISALSQESASKTIYNFIYLCMAWSVLVSSMAGYMISADCFGGSGELGHQQIRWLWGAQCCDGKSLYYRCGPQCQAPYDGSNNLPLGAEGWWAALRSLCNLTTFSVTLGINWFFTMLFVGIHFNLENHISTKDQTPAYLLLWSVIGIAIVWTTVVAVAHRQATKRYHANGGCCV